MTRGRHDAAFRVALVACLFAWLGGLGHAQQATAPPEPQPTFRAAIDVATLSVTVLDGQRRPVRGLTAADFTVLEEGEARPIVAVTPIEVPANRPANLPVWQDQVVEDVVTNAPKAGRLVVVFFDRSIRPPWEPSRARLIAARVIDELGPEDVAAVVYNYRGATPLNFTADRKRLRAAVESPVIGIQRYPGGESGECTCNVCGVESIGVVAHAMEAVRGRQKILVYIGGNLPMSLADYQPWELMRGGSDCSSRLNVATQDMFEAAQRAQLVIHALDPGGLRPPDEFTAGYKDKQLIRSLGEPTPPDPATLWNLAEITGGSAVLSNNSPEAEVPRLFEESSASYLVGFAPRLPAADGKPRRLRVRVRGDGLTVLAPSTYWPAAPAGGARAPASGASRPRSASAQAIEGLTPVADIVMRAAAIAVPDPATPARAAIATVLGMAIPVGATGNAPITVETEVTAFDTDGRRAASDRQTLTLTPRPGATTIAFDMLSRLALPRGRYEIRATVSVAPGSRAGSVFTFLDVDNFSKTQLAVSGLALHAAPAPRLVAAVGPESWLPLPPTTERTYTQDTEVSGGIRLLQVKGAPQPVEVTVRLQDARGQRVVDRTSRLLPTDFDARRLADYRFDLPLATLTPGEYLLTIAVTQGETTASRTARFRVQ